MSRSSHATSTHPAVDGKPVQVVYATETLSAEQAAARLLDLMSDASVRKLLERVTALEEQVSRIERALLRPENDR